MPKQFNLGRTNQCAGCPWKAGVDPASIPNGFCHRSHQRIGEHTALPGELLLPQPELRIMQCHDSSDDKPQHCVGWLHNQLFTDATNVGLRIRMMGCDNIDKLRLDGPQRESFEELIPTKPTTNV